jgi:CRP-like cAMP-binding protein
MPDAHPPPAPPGNRLLARLPPDDYHHLLPHLQPTAFAPKQVLYQADSPIDFAYFPTRGVLSAGSVMGDGSSIEVAAFGNEGMVGLAVLLETGTALHRVIVQVPGERLRIRADDLKAETDRSAALRSLLARYQAAVLMQTAQSAACNGLHTVRQRCCRWLLLTHDSLGEEDLPLTHELLGMMLGVRRNSVTEVLHPLREHGVIGTGRGTIAVLDREKLEAASCECYRTVKERFGRLLG